MYNHEEGADRLSLVMERLVRSLRALISDDPLSQASSSVLSRLDMDGASGITALAKAERVSQPAMTQLVTRLQAEGLVSRELSETDRRYVVVDLTASGRAALHARRRRRAARVSEALAVLNETERQAVMAALPALERLASITHMDPEALLQFPSADPQ